MKLEVGPTSGQVRMEQTKSHTELRGGMCAEPETRLGKRGEEQHLQPRRNIVVNLSFNCKC